MFLETQAGSEFAIRVRSRDRTSQKRPVNERLGHIFHFLFSICHLLFLAD
jgi:hypothetical protein